MPSKRDQQNFRSFYPSEPFKNGHFNVRHPVQTLASKDSADLMMDKQSEFLVPKLSYQLKKKLSLIITQELGGNTLDSIKILSYL